MNAGTCGMIIRWLFQSGVIIIPKSTHRNRMAENLDILNFTLDTDDMAAIATLDLGRSLFLDHHSGADAKQFMQWRSLVTPTK